MRVAAPKILGKRITYTSLEPKLVGIVPCGNHSTHINKTILASAKGSGGVRESDLEVLRGSME